MVCAEDGAALDAAAGEEGELLRPVVAAGGGGQRTHGAAELADHHHQRAAQQAVGLQIAQQRRNRVVQNRALVVGHGSGWFRW